MTDEQQGSGRTDLDTDVPDDGFGMPGIDPAAARDALSGEEGSSPVGPEDAGTPEAEAEMAGE